MRVPLSRLLIKDNVPAGANFLVIATLVLKYRTTSEDADPALVRYEGAGLWRILDGRHRFMASIIAGRCDLLCEPERINGATQDHLVETLPLALIGD